MAFLRYTLDIDSKIMNKIGQSIVEYALIAILVILGVVFMGPYVLRSVNAHFKLWDDGVQDSITEHLTQAPVGAIPPIDINCHCTKVPAATCGNSQTGASCPPNTREVDNFCTPQGCNPVVTPSTCDPAKDPTCNLAANASTCVPDPSCCTDGVLGCGTGVGTVPPECNGESFINNILCSQAANCPIGYKIHSHQCGSTIYINCAQDPSCPLPPTPACLGNLTLLDKTPAAAYCPQSQTSSLDQDYPITYVANAAACTGAKCQAYCTVQGASSLNAADQNTLAQNACIPSYSVYCNPSAGYTDLMNVTFADGTSLVFNNNTLIIGAKSGSLSPPVAAYGIAYNSNGTLGCPYSPDPNKDQSKLTNTATFHVPGSNQWIFRYDDCKGWNPDHDFNDIQCVFILGGTSLAQSLNNFNIDANSTIYSRCDSKGVGDISNEICTMTNGLGTSTDACSNHPNNWLWNIKQCPS